MFAPPAAGQKKALHPSSQAIRDYLVAGDKVRYDTLPEGVVSIGVTHSNLQFSMADIRFDLHTRIDGVKEKLYTHCGTKPHHQRLILKTSDGATIGAMDDDNKKLGYYGVENGMVVHIIDDDPFSLSRNGGLEDVSQVKKYRMAEDDYDSRKGTLREWIKQQKAKDPNWKAPWNKGQEEEGAAAPAAKPAGPPPGPESVVGVEVGMRCECQPGARRGTVMYTGLIEEIGEGYWVGVKFDEPLGRNDGSTKSGTRYFECPPKYGTFIRPQHVTVGDFPERDLLDGDDDEDEI